MALLGQASANETQRQMELHKNSNHKHMSQIRAIGGDEDTDTEPNAVVEEIKAKVAKE